MKPDDKTHSRAPTAEDELFFRLLTAELNITKLFDQMDVMTKTLQKLEAAYYEAFPDRLDKDERFEDQLRALKNPRTPPKQ